MRRLGSRSGDEIRRLRLDAGISVAALADVVGVHRSHLARVEAGQARPSLRTLTAIGVALGADLSLRFFAGAGPRLYDRFQAAMTETFLGALHPRWNAELEVPITRPSRGVIDIVLSGRGGATGGRTRVTIATEVQSELRRLEETLRWMAEKAAGLGERVTDSSSRDGTIETSRLLVLRSTVVTRDLARRYRGTLATAFPARTAAIFEALTTESGAWPGAGIVWMRVDGGTAALLRFPPRGVEVGR